MLAHGIELFNSKCNPSSTAVNASVRLHQDISSLLPLLNATEEKARYFPHVPYVTFRWKGRVVNVEPRTVNLFGCQDEEEARREARAVVQRLEELLQDPGGVEPDPTPFEPPSVVAVLRHLPRVPGCNEGPHPSCMAFASALVRGEASPADCPVLHRAPFADRKDALVRLLEGGRPQPEARS